MKYILLKLFYFVCCILQSEKVKHENENDQVKHKEEYDQVKHKKEHDQVIGKMT